MPLVALTSLLMFVGVYALVEHRARHERLLRPLLLLEVGINGTFVAMDIFLFYVFWEIMLLPMYFLIGIWGGPRREYAAIKFFLYTLAGSVLMLVAIVALLHRDRHLRDPELRRLGGVAHAGLELARTGQINANNSPAACSWACRSAIGCSGSSSSRSRSRCRSSRSTPGCPTRTWRPRRRSP